MLSKFEQVKRTGKGPLGRPKVRLEDSIIINLKGIGVRMRN